MAQVLAHLQERIDARRKRQHMLQIAISLGAFVIVLWSVKVIIINDTDWERMGSFANILETIGRFFDLDFTLIPHLGVPIVETFIMACLGTVLGLVISLPVAWFGAYNITPSKKIFYPLGRLLMTISRSIHEIVWALLFVSAVGLGALPGILAIAMRSVGFISKMIAEAIENIDTKPIEAIRSVGGNSFQVLYYGIIPQIKALVLGTIIFEWDINIRRSAVMGVVGAGGLGLTFFRQMGMYNYGGITVVIIAILALILLGEIVSHMVRKRIN